MRDFVSRALSIFAGLVLFTAFMAAVLYYTTPPWMRQMAADSSRLMEQLFGPRPISAEERTARYWGARPKCERAHPLPEGGEEMKALISARNPRPERPGFNWEAYDRADAARWDCMRREADRRP